MPAIQSRRRIPGRSARQTALRPTPSPVAVLLVLVATQRSSGMRRAFAGAGDAARTALLPKGKQSYELLEKTRLTHNSFLLRYALPEGRSILGVDPLLPTCVKVDYEPDVPEHKKLSKSYSPVSHNTSRYRQVEGCVKASMPTRWHLNASVP